MPVLVDLDGRNLKLWRVRLNLRPIRRRRNQKEAPNGGSVLHLRRVIFSSGETPERLRQFHPSRWAVLRKGPFVRRKSSVTTRATLLFMHPATAVRLLKLPALGTGVRIAREVRRKPAP